VTRAAIEWSTRRKPSVLGMISGAVAGLHHRAGIGFGGAPARYRHRHHRRVGPLLACTWLKHRFSDDDSLDVFGVQCIGGLTGTRLAGVSATSAIGGTAGLIEGHPPAIFDAASRRPVRALARLA
jgi:Amt family ammonium transporter